ILSTTFIEGRERNIALGVWGAVGGFGAAAGVLLGGILTSALSWSWIFFVNVPVGVTAFVLAPILLKESRDARVKSFDALRDVLALPDADALHAAGARLLADEDRRGLPRRGRRGDLHLGDRRAARDPDRSEAGIGDRDDVTHGRPRVLHAGLCRRLVSR